ncbi:MAG: site-specific integrase [Melioribacteraceae bacterium]|jgi:integrase|nr:site-specific integrase [Melioribacteraceae bacterium]
MEKYSLDGVIASVYFDDRRPKNVPESVENIKISDLRYPVKYRIFYMGKYYFHASGIDLTKKEWTGLSSTRKKELIETRELIQSGFEKIKTHIKELVKGEGFSIEGLDKRLSRGRKDSILTAFYNKIEDLTKTGQIGTASGYQCAINSIMKFTNKDLKFSDITIDWLKKYEAHLRTERTEITAEGKSKTIKARSITTVKFYIGALRSIMNEGKEDRIILESQYPFGKGKYEIKSGDGRKMALNLAQIKAVLNYELTTDIEKRSRDLWFFSYLCNGININDLCRLKHKDIAGGEIHFIRQKTIRTTKKQKEIAATLLPQMIDIIKKWGTKDKKPDSYIFPFLSHVHKSNDEKQAKDEKKIIQNCTRLINKKMAAISTALNYDNISTYTARHSYATVLKRSGANIAFISESLGHSDLRTTENYLASFEQEERAKNASKLTDF